MATSTSTVEMLKRFWNSQVIDEEQLMLTYRVLKAAGLFAGSVFLMHNFGQMISPDFY